MGRLDARISDRGRSLIVEAIVGGDDGVLESWMSRESLELRSIHWLV